MSTRSTPFGLFSFVSWGAFAESNSIQFDLKKVVKRARPDMEWLLALVNQVGEDPNYFLSLPVYQNPLVFKSGGRAFLNYVRQENSEGEQKAVSIKTSFLTDAIFQIAKKPVIVKELLNSLMHRFPNLNNDQDKEKVERVIKQLLKQQFLCFKLMPSLLTETPFRDLISKVNSIPSFLVSIKATW